MTATGTGDGPDLLDTPEAGGAAIRGSLVRTLGIGATLLLGLVSAPILTRYLGVDDFGRYMTVVSLIALVASVTDAGLNSFGTRELAVLPERAREHLMRNLLGIRIALSLAGIGVAVVFALAAGYDDALVLGVVLAGAGMLVFVLQSMLGLPLVVELRYGWLTAAEVLRQVIYLGVIVALVLAGAGVTPLLGAPIVGGLVGTAITMRLVRGRVPYRPAADRAAWARILRQTLPIATAGAINSVYFRFVILLMSVLATERQTGLFAISFRVVDVAVAVPVVVISAVLPIFSRAAHSDRARMAYAFGRTLDVAIIGGTFFTLLGAVGAPLAIGFLTGDPGSGATAVLRIQSLALLAVFVDVACTAALFALNRQRALVLVNVAALITTAITAAVLVPLAGAKGGAVAAVAGEWALLCACVLFLRRAELHPPLSAVPRAAAAAGAALLAVALLPSLPHLPNLGDVLIAAVVYPLVLAAVGGVPRELVPALLGRR